ncbi:hypothetical protein ACROYT_G031795 [Oculina patagonica]
MGLQTFCKSLRDTHIRLLIDNTTAIAVLNHMGTSHSKPCNRLGKEIWEWCICDLYISTKNHGGRSNRDLRHPRLADAGVVPQSYADVCLSTAKTRTGKKPLETPGTSKGIAPATQISGIANLPLIREQLNTIGLSSDTVNILMASWRKSTGKQYNTYLSRWLLFCQEKHMNMNQATVNDGLEFLTSLYRQGLGYSAINTARSALSSVITLGGKTTFGEHPLVTRFLKGIFELKPSLPRYTVIWDVGTVLKFLQTFPPITDLTLKQLTKKLVTLLALVTAQRTQTLSKLDMTFMQDLPDKIVFSIRDRLKTTRPGKHLDPIEILAYTADPRLCPVTHVKQYIVTTQALRQTTTLLISYTKPHKAVTNSTIARWVKSILKDAGIDINTFSAHSSRTAASSYGLSSGLPLQDILKAGGWSNAEVFARHYNKPLAQNFGNAILDRFTRHENNDS